MIYTWGNERRFNAYADFFKKEFGGRVQKLTINAGFTCPNRDGKVGRGGCTFCDNSAFNPSYNDARKPVLQQLNEGIEFHKIRYRKVTKYLAYFQAFSNTYAPLEKLREIYRPALEHPDVIGIVIGTRPDCVDDEILDYLAELSKETYLVVEYGIESINNETLKAINRGHTFEKTEWAIRESAKRGIRIGGHIIIGLPGEDNADWFHSAEVLSQLPLHSVKFHQLQIVKGTAMEKDFLANPARFREFELDEYLQLMCEILVRINPEFVVERIAGEVSPGKAAREGWKIRYDQVLHRFEQMLEEKDLWQGKMYK